MSAPLAMSAPEPPWAPAQPPAHMLLQEWKYEMRREAQQIVPGVYLGPFQASTSLSNLRNLGITHIICLRDGVEARLIFPRFPTEFRYLTQDISDSGIQNIISLFSKTRAFIDEALLQGGAVLVHCNSGISTSPAIVMGYLMDKFRWDYQTALMYVQSKRYCVSPNSFEIQLREYGAIVAARHAYVGGNGMAEHKRQWDGDGEAPVSKRRQQSPDSDMDYS